MEKGTTSRGREDPKLSARRSSGAEPIAPGNVNGKTPGILAEVRQGQLVASNPSKEPTTARSTSISAAWKRPSICDSLRKVHSSKFGERRDCETERDIRNKNSDFYRLLIIFIVSMSLF